jgi:arginase
VAFHAILAPYDLDVFDRGTGAGPEALVAHGALAGLDVTGTTAVHPPSVGHGASGASTSAASQVQQCIAIDAAIARAVRAVCDDGGVPIVLSGNCHACLGTLSGLGARASVIWFDAHGDLNTPDTTETGYFDGMALATALGWAWTSMTRQIPGFAAASASDALLIGGRDLDPAERQLLERSRVAHHAPAPLAERIAADLERALAEPARAQRAYVHLDLDVMDPSIMRANRFEAPGGVTTTWLEGALGAVRRRHDIVAVGVTAYDPAYTAPHTAAPIVNRLLRALLHTGP